MVEICCNPNSKLSDVSRKPADGSRVIQFKEKDNLLDEHYIDSMSQVSSMSFLRIGKSFCG